MRLDLFIHVLGNQQQIDLLLKQGELIMATLQEQLQQIKDAIATVKTDIASEKAEVQTMITDLKAQIQTLQDQIGAGTPITSADLQGLLDSLAEIDTGVKDISEPVVPPTP